MIIDYKNNPLNTTVTLDDTEKLVLWYKIKVQQLNYLMFDAGWFINPNRLDLDKARKSLDSDYYLVKGGNLDKRCDAILKEYLDELQGSHSGDCTACAYTCTKCSAESLLGIDTIPKLRKMTGSWLARAYNDGRENIQEALQWLVAENPEGSPDSARWILELEIAYEWLKQYQRTDCFRLDTIKLTPYN